MAGFATYSAVRAAYEAGKVERAYYIKTVQTGLHDTTLSTLWTVADVPAAGANPAAAGSGGTVYTNSANSIFFPDRAGTNKYIANVAGWVQGTSTVASHRTAFLLHDRLVGVGSISAVAGTPAVNTPASPRYTTGYGVYAWIELVSSAGANQTVSMTYTNHLGATGRVGTTTTIPAIALSGLIYPLPLAPGDLGVRSVQSLTITGAGSGTYNVVLVRPILGAPFISDNTMYPTCNTDFMRGRVSFPQIFDGASLMIAYWYSNGGVANIFHRGYVEMVYT